MAPRDATTAVSSAHCTLCFVCSSERRGLGRMDMERQITANLATPQLVRNVTEPPMEHHDTWLMAVISCMRALHAPNALAPTPSSASRRCARASWSW
ncbi:hypothetical protein BJV74DRAFT_856297 [Russula compacta]|nr:hypothetical protein BJV74DRAFT_856297 [Russula compacta]